MSPLRAIAAVALLLAGGDAFAAADARDQARGLYESGTAHYNLGELKEALSDFQGAYRLVHEPTLLFNIAQCYRRMDQPRQAAELYRAYRREQPEAPNRAEVDRLIREMDERAPPSPSPSPQQPLLAPVDDATTLTGAAPATTAPAPHRTATPLYRRWWLWTAVGAVAAGGLAVGLGVGLSQPSAAGSDLGKVRPF
jgi:tetratricopeptide (TPR) repeat protein